MMLGVRFRERAEADQFAQSFGGVVEIIRS
jgi:hypothetical protein